MGFKNNLATIVITMIVTLTAFPTVINLAKIIETKYFPVIQEIEFTKVMRDGDQTVVYGDTVKRRDCHFENVAFYKKTRFGDEMISSERLRPRTVDSAPKGDTRFGPWKVDANKEEFNSIVSIRTLHRCHPLYLTESIIYNGERDQ